MCYAWERRGKCTGFWWESPKEIDELEDRGVDGRMGSEWILGRLAGGVEWIQWSVAGSCKYCDEPLGSGATDLFSRP
jgi:hypothetical protein